MPSANHIIPWWPHSPPQAAGNTRPLQRLGGPTGPLRGRTAGTCRKPPPRTAWSPVAEAGGAACLLSRPVFQVLLRMRAKSSRASPEMAGRPEHSPEVGLGELLHVELFIREGCEVDVTNGGEHVSWEWGAGRGAGIRVGLPAGPGRTSKGPQDPQPWAFPAFPSLIRGFV